MTLIVKDWKKLLVGFNMFILLFDIDASISYRCHQYCSTLLWICVLLINCCGTTETTTSKIDVAASDASPTSPVLSPTPVKQPKPSSVIYIPSLDDVNTVSSLHSSEHDIRFEDFFWNGSGDEPLTLSLKSNARLTAVNGFVGRETFIKTATVIATVYIDDSSEDEKDPNCKSDGCDTDSNEIPDEYLPVNKRFWLVTSVLGHLNDEDIPLLQERLADIYRIAFTRQQSLHLGLSNATVIDSTVEPLPGASLANETTPIIENKQSTNSSMPINPTSVLKYEYGVAEPSAFHIQSNVSITDATMSMETNLLLTESGNATSTLNVVATTSSNHIDKHHRRKRSVSSITPSPVHVSTTSTHIVLHPANAKLQSMNISDISNNSKSNGLKQASANGRTNMTTKPSKGAKKNRNDAIIGHISVLIHNISVISNGDKDYSDNSDKEWGNPVQGSSSSNSSTSDPFIIAADNQTEIIYTVFVNGIPVLATIAANDMKLMSEVEVSKILEKPIFTKAEPYLKEPQATPLIPSSTMTTNPNKPILAMIFQNPYILAFIIALMLLIILLLMILMLVTGTKNQRRTTRKGVSKAAQTAQQSFLPPVPVAVSPVSVAQSQPQSNANTTIGHMPSIDESHQFRTNMTNEIPSRHSNTVRQKKQVGTQITSLHDTVNGFTCERDHSFIIIPTPLKRKHHHKKVGTPTIYFPEPPSSEPSSPSHSQTQSTTSTSDTSSIYYIKKHKNHRRHHLYSKRPKRVASLNHREYATITKKQIERAQKKSKHKRKYLTGGNGNRVGAFDDTVQVHSSRSSSATGQTERLDECKPKLHRNDAKTAAIASAAVSDDTFEMSTGKDSNLYEHIEAFNPMVAKKSKFHNQFMSTKQMDNGGKSTKISNETEKHVQSKSHLNDKRQNKIGSTVNQVRNGMNAFAVNSVSDRHKAKKADDDQRHAKESYNQSSNNTSDESRAQRKDRFSHQLSNDEVHITNDDLSIGSFLSMASIRSFPKCNVPEALNRVLEPVSNTHLDEYDEIDATEAATIASKLPRIVDAKAKCPPKSMHIPCEQTPNEKMSDEIIYLSRTRSDGADPGVIGPIAWQYHKKRLEEQEKAKLHRDPTCTQHRYEDLLEGAISLYSIETTEYHTIETITKEEFPEILIGKDMRGKSADIFPNSPSELKSSPNPYRPFTAMLASKMAPEEPLITSKGAWTGSTVIRPTSGDKDQPTDDPPQRSPKSSLQNNPE
ncbi:uncharacterized protein LOC129578490 isoform X2 [Sitodiplosis mosellana]|uniref:uncharacterized protein LOC129578490 isoform X2 n=1 Tax=Sitodiplosis mosellana TaxID=263140 RepID=UPI002443D515|nr:uncharacterized protein LOC129578490 isoform X2 [Sitodiplosis mosellana]